RSLLTRIAIEPIVEGTVPASNLLVGELMTVLLGQHVSTDTHGVDVRGMDAGALHGLGQSAGNVRRTGAGLLFDHRPRLGHDVLDPTLVRRSETPRADRRDHTHR